MVGTCQCCVSVDVCIPLAAPICHTSAIGQRREDSGSCIHHLSSCFDYCNSLLFGISDSLLRRLQAVQNAAAHDVTCYWYPTSWAHHARLEATSLAASATAHWSCSFGVRSTEWPVSTIFGGWLPAYHCITGRRRLRSSNIATREVPTTRTSLCDRSFTVAGASTWLRTYSRGVTPVAEVAPLSLRTVAPSDCLLSALNICIYVTFTCTV